MTKGRYRAARAARNTIKDAFLFTTISIILHDHYCQDFLAEVTSVGLQTQYEAVCENLGLIAYLVQVLDDTSVLI